jgi:hypothetical protein
MGNKIIEVQKDARFRHFACGSTLQLLSICEYYPLSLGSPPANR